MKFLNALEQARWHIRTLWGVIGLCVLINLVTLVGWMRTQDHIKIDVPRPIPDSGLTLTAGEVPKTTVYSFAFYVWQSINHWSNDGVKDYQQQITRLSPYLTPNFKLQLIQHYNNLLNQGELQDRIRLMQGLAGSEYVPSDVTAVGHDTWVVTLKMRLREFMNMNAKVVKDVEMQYQLVVVRDDIDATKNPWGLAIAGFSNSPKRLKTMV